MLSRNDVGKAIKNIDWIDTRLEWELKGVDEENGMIWVYDKTEHHNYLNSDSWTVVKEREEGKYK